MLYCGERSKSADFVVKVLIILRAWEADERALLRAEDEGMGGGEHAHLHKVQAALDHLSEEPCPSLDIEAAVQNPSALSRIAVARRGAELRRNREKSHV